MMMYFTSFPEYYTFKLQFKYKSSHKYSFYFGHLRQIRAQIRRWSCHKSADDLGTNPQKIRAQIRGRSLAPITVCFTGIFMRSVRASSAVGRGCPGPGWNPRRTPPGTSGGRTRRICPPGGGLVSLHLLAPLVEDPWWANTTLSKILHYQHHFRANCAISNDKIINISVS